MFLHRPPSLYLCQFGTRSRLSDEWQGSGEMDSLNSRRPGYSECSHCGCMQTVWTPLQERDWAWWRMWRWSRPWLHQTAPACIDGWLSWGKTSMEHMTFSSNQSCFLLLFCSTVLSFFNAHSDTFYNVQTENKCWTILGLSIWVSFGYCDFLGGLSLKWERKTTVWTCLLFAEYKTGQTDWNEEHLMMC